jgi:hypothetical protein
MVRAQKGILESVFIAVVGSAAVVAFTRASQFAGIVAGVLLGFSRLNMLRKGNDTRMIVWAHGFRAEGNIDRALADSVQVTVNEIYGIGYFIGGEDDPSGLYALRRFGNTSLIPGLDEKRCGEIKAAIEAKFPEMQFGQQQLSGIFGSGPEIISLSLNTRSKTATKDSIS